MPQNYLLGDLEKMEEINGIKYVYRTLADKIIDRNLILKDVTTLIPDLESKLKVPVETEQDAIENLEILKDHLIQTYSNSYIIKTPLINEDCDFLNKEVLYIQKHLNSKPIGYQSEQIFEHIPYDFFEIEHTLIIEQRRLLAPLIRRKIEKSN